MFELLNEGPDEERWFPETNAEHDVVFRVSEIGLHISAFGIKGGKNWRIDRTNSQTFNMLVRQVNPLISTLSMPIPSHMNGKIIRAKDMKREYFQQGVTVLGKEHADGIILQRGEAYGVTSADCPTFTFWSSENDTVIAGHAGLRSIIQKSVNERGEYAEQKHSVIKNALNELRVTDMNSVSAHILCGARTGFIYSRKHPTFGHGNMQIQNLIEAMYPHSGIISSDEAINMPRLVVAEMCRYGVPIENITFDGGDGIEIDTHGDRDIFGNPKWASQSRDPKSGRNFVLVQRF